MHTKNQIDTVHTTIETLMTIINTDTDLTNYDDLYELLMHIEEIIENGYSTDHMSNAYSNPVEEAISTLSRAMIIVNSEK